MKKLLIGSMILIAMGSLTGCGSNSTSSTKTEVNSEQVTTEAEVIDFDVKDLASKLLEEGSFKDQLAEISNDIALARLFVIDSSKVESAIVYTNTNATAEEIAIIKTTSSEATSEVEAAYKKRIEDQKAACESYLPDEMPKLDSANIVIKGNYAVLVISEDSQKASDIIAEYIK